MTLDEFGFQYGDSPIRTISGSDKDSTCIHLMKNFKNPTTNACLFMHVFLAVETHLSTKSQRMIDALTPNPDMVRRTREECYQLIDAYLGDFGDVAFENGRATAPCALHLQQCPIYDIYSDDNHKMASQVSSTS